MNAFLKIFSLLDRQSRLKSFHTFLIVSLMAVMDAIGIASIMPFLTVLGDPTILETDPYLNYLYLLSLEYGVQTESGFIIVLAIVVFTLILFSGIYRTFAIYALNNLIEGLRSNIGQKVFRGFLCQNYFFFVENNTSDLAKTVLSEVDNLTGSVLRPTFHMLANMVSCSAIIIILLLVNPMLLLMTVTILGVLYYLIYRAIRSTLQDFGRKRFLANKERFFWVNEAFSSIKLLKLRRLEDTFVQQFREPAQNYAKSVSLFATLNQAPKYLIEVLAFGGLLTLIITLMYSNYGVLVGDVGSILPTLGLYAFATYKLQPSLQAIFNGVSSLRFGADAIDNIVNYIPAKDLDPLQVKQSDFDLTHDDTIRLNNVSFKYPGSKKSVLNNITLNIPLGTSLAIVGPTGSGKTTLVDILLGLITPDQGQIELINSDNQILRPIDIQSLMGYVPQEVVLTDGSVSENIAFGVPKDKINQDRVKKCVEVAQIKDFIERSLPNSYDSMVGQRGVKLSGGQKQRLGIARALYNDPKILVFDESTSALDQKTEDLVMTAINALSDEVTTIFITHRLSTIQNCEKIYLLESGQLGSISYTDLENRF